MVQLSVEDRQQLVDLLQGIPELASESSRALMLELAGLTKLIARIDVSGPTFVAINHIISFLASYGRLTYEREALGVFLNSLKSYVGIEQQKFLDTLLLKYDMTTPIAASPDVDLWRGVEDASAVFEKIVGENTLRPIAFLAQGVEVARSIAYIEVTAGASMWSGTGFLIAPDFLMTNHHVLPRADLLSTTLFRFNYEENALGEALPYVDYRALAGGYFHANEHLDYAVVQLQERAGEEWGWLHLVPQSVRRNDRLNIIQHPDGQPKQVSIQNNFAQFVGGDVVQYVTSTKRGSSGSPVLNDEWNVVAVHHAGGNIREPGTERWYFRNEGFLVSSILADLPHTLREQLEVAS